MRKQNESFCKNKDCPASEQILALCENTAGPVMAGRVGKHLQECDFCAAELEFYRYFPPVEETVSTVEIPKPLFDLAYALLRRDRDLSPLYRLIGD